MMKKPLISYSGTDAEYCICKAATSLIPLYSESKEDRPDSLLVKYVGGRQGLEIWFMPIEGTPIVLPGLLKMPTGVGTMEIEAERLERAVVKPAADPGSAR